MFTRRFPEPEFESDEEGRPPSRTELKWQIRSARQDLPMLAITNFAVLLALVFALMPKLQCPTLLASRIQTPVS